VRTTIKDISLATGFSVTTISLVLNGKGHKISEETKNRILEAAREMNYRPNQLAVSLVKKRSKTIGLIIPDIGNAYFANMARAIDEGCQDGGWSVILCNTGDRHYRDMEYIKLLADKGADGIIFIMAQDTTRQMALEALELLEEVRIPYTVLDRIPEDALCPGVGTDHEQGGYLATRHLIELGHERIACVVGLPASQMDSESRFQGYCRALREAHLPIYRELICIGEYTKEGGEAAVDQLIQQDFTAIFACNDASAYGVCKRLREYGRCVPDEISVVGYDDVFYASMLGVPLTTVRQQIHAMGLEAARQILRQIRGEGGEKTRAIFKPELVVRDSTARRR
jgi:LacI family transcriptional regulator